MRWRNNGMELVQALRRPGYGTAEPTWWTRGVYSVDRRGQIDIPANRYVNGPRDTEQFKQSLIGRVGGVFQAARNQQRRA